MKKNWKKASIFVVVAAMILTLTACSSTDTTSAGSSSATPSSSEAQPSSEASEDVAAPESTESAPASGDVTEESYKAEVVRIFTSITEKTQAMASADTTDPLAMIETMTPVIEEVTPLYLELAALKAPESLQAEQTAISEGATASADMLKLSLEMFNIAAGKATGDAEQLQADAQAKITELTPKLTAFNEALQKVMA